MIDYVEGIFEPINVQIVPLSVHGAHCRNADSSFSVFLNASDSRERQLQAYQHEIDHIREGDLDLRDADQAERRRRWPQP